MIKKQQYDLKSEHELEKKRSIIITFCSMAVEFFLNDYAAACIGDINYVLLKINLSIKH